VQTVYLADKYTVISIICTICTFCSRNIPIWPRAP